MRKLVVISVILSLALAVLFIKSENARYVFLPKNTLQTVVVDAGHGGVDGGAVGVTGVYEKDLNLEISERLCDVLRFCGVNVIMTRNEDKSIHKDEANTIREKKASAINERIKLIENTDNARLISVHLNHFSQISCRGAQVFYSGNDKSIVFANSVQETLKLIDSENKRTAQKAGGHIYLLKNVSCPAILVECGFLSNPFEEEKLKTADYQKKLAICIASGYINVKNEL